MDLPTPTFVAFSRASAIARSLDLAWASKASLARAFASLADLLFVALLSSSLFNASRISFCYIIILSFAVGRPR